MSIHAEKTQENKSQSFSNNIVQRKSNEESTFQFMDNRSEATAQLQLQDMADNSPQVSQLRSFQDMADNSSRRNPTVQLQTMADYSPRTNQTIQLESMSENNSAEQSQPTQTQENNTGLPDNLKSGMESLSGMSLGDVKVHRNSDKPAQLQAHAYAQGSDIHLAPGQEQHLPHELGHVVQQKQGRVKPTKQMKGKVAVNDDAGLESEATVMGAKALSIGQLKTADNQLDESSTSNQTVQGMFGSQSKVHQFGGPEVKGGADYAKDLYSEEANEDAEPVSVREAAEETRDAMATVGVANGDDEVSVNLLDGSASATIGGAEFGADFKEKKFTGEVWGYKAEIDLVKGEGKLEFPETEILPEKEFAHSFELPVPGTPIVISFGASVKAKLGMKGEIVVTRKEAPDADGLQQWRILGTGSLEGSAGGEVNAGVGVGLANVASIGGEVFGAIDSELKTSIAPQGDFQFNHKTGFKNSLIGNVKIPTDLTASIISTIGLRATLKLLFKKINLGEITLKEWPIAWAKYNKLFDIAPGAGLTAFPGAFDYGWGGAPEIDGIFLSKTASAIDARKATADKIQSKEEEIGDLEKIIQQHRQIQGLYEAYPKTRDMWKLPKESVASLEKEIAKARGKIEQMESESSEKYAKLDKAALEQGNDTAALYLGKIYKLNEKLNEYKQRLEGYESAQRTEKKLLDKEEANLAKIDKVGLMGKINEDTKFINNATSKATREKISQLAYDVTKKRLERNKTLLKNIDYEYQTQQQVFYQQRAKLDEASANIAAVNSKIVAQRENIKVALFEQKKAKDSMAKIKSLGD